MVAAVVWCSFLFTACFAVPSDSGESLSRRNWKALLALSANPYLRLFERRYSRRDYYANIKPAGVIDHRADVVPLTDSGAA